MSDPNDWIETAKLIGTGIAALTGAAGAFAAKRGVGRTDSAATMLAKKVDELAEKFAEHRGETQGEIRELKDSFGRYAEATELKIERINHRIAWIAPDDEDEVTPAPSTPDTRDTRRR